MIGLLLAGLGSLGKQEGLDILVVGIVKRGGSPSVVRVDLSSIFKKMFYRIELIGSCSNVERSALVIVTLVDVDTFLDKEVENSHVSTGGGLACGNHSPDLLFIWLSGTVNQGNFL